MEQRIIYLIIVIVIFAYIIIQRAYLEKYATTKPKDVQHITIHNLSLYADKKPTCTISRRITFFWKIYYMPYTDMITVIEGADNNKWGTPYMVFYHKAFKRGKLVFKDVKDTTNVMLNSLGYAIKKVDSYLAQ